MADVVHDSEYYILDAQHGEVWAGEDRDLDAKLAGMGERFGSPPNIIHIMWDDTAVGEIGIPAVQRVRGFETPNMNRLAAEGINFMRMYTEPSCTPSRAAVITGRHAMRSGMYNVSFPYEYGGLPSSEVTMADVLSEAGYATAFYGKAHLGDIEASYMTNRGFDEALWMPYNQVPSLFTPQGQMAVLSPAVMFPEMFPEDRYDKDPGWRPNGYVFALEGTKGATSGSGSASIPVCPGPRSSICSPIHASRAARCFRMFPAKGMFNMMKARHQLWVEKYPHTAEERGWPLTGIANVRPETKAAGQPRVDLSKLPFDPLEGLAKCFADGKGSGVRQD